VTFQPAASHCDYAAATAATTTTGKTTLFELMPSLEDSVRLHPAFTSLDFATIFFFFY
jgi:hypothetical protein